MQAVIKRLNVDIGRADIHGAVDNLVDQADDRRLAGEVLEVLNEFVIALACKAITQFIFIITRCALVPGLKRLGNV